ncbi:MAG: hypothetical protein M3083_16495 [Actinomycetota bacterium]|nr:hypothetical protein [Actinomycetota bacterium]
MVNGNGSYTSGPFSATRAGLYRFVAAYNGNPNNNAAVTACADANQTVTVTKASPMVATKAWAPVLLGGTITDTATVSDGYTATERLPSLCSARTTQLETEQGSSLRHGPSPETAPTFHRLSP